MDCFVQLLFLIVGFACGVDGVTDDAAPDQKVVFRVIHIHRRLARVECGSLALGFAVVASVPSVNILESRFKVLLVNAGHLKQVPGRKSDIRDCQWIAQLLQCGLLKGSFIPPRTQRELRDLTRHRVQLVEEKTRTSNRIEKVLEDANIKLVRWPVR